MVRAIRARLPADEHTYVGQEREPGSSMTDGSHCSIVQVFPRWGSRDTVGSMGTCQNLEAERPACAGVHYQWRIVRSVSRSGEHWRCLTSALSGTLAGHGLPTCRPVVGCFMCQLSCPYSGAKGSASSAGRGRMCGMRCSRMSSRRIGSFFAARPPCVGFMRRVSA